MALDSAKREFLALLLSCAATVISIFSYVESRGTEEATNKIKVDEHLDKAWDLMGGAPGTDEIYPDAQRSQPDLKLAEREIDAALRLDESDSRALQYKGINLAFQGDLEAALAYQDKAIVNDPEYASAYISAGSLLLKMGQTQKSEKMFRDAAEIDPKNKEVCALANHNLAVLYRQNANNQVCIESYRKAIDCEPWRASHLWSLGDYLLETGKVEESIPLFERAITIDESHFDSFHSLGVALRAAGRPAEAEEIFRRALKRQPQSGIALVGLGDALFDQQRYLEAENYYIQAAAIDSRNASAHSHRALAILAANPESVRAKVEARSLIQKAIDVDPEDPSVLCNVGILLAYIGDLNSSVKYLRQSVEQGSAQWSCQFELASSLVQMGKYDEALVHAKAADGLKPSTPKILKLLAGINRKLGHQAEFQAAVQRLKDLGATNEAARTKAALAGGSKEN